MCASITRRLEEKLATETRSRLTVDGEDLVVSMDDLAVVADAMGARPNALSLIPQGSGDKDAPAAAEFRAMAPGTQARLAIALGILRAPAKIAHWHHTIADATVCRAVLAWSPSAPNMVVAIGGTAEPRRVTFWTQASLTASIRKVLAADGVLRDDEIGCKLTTPAVVVFLAVIDQTRAVHLHSMLTHTAPLAHFCQQEIMDRLQDAASEDYRWPLLFVEKLIPGQLVNSLNEVEVAAALQELVQANLLEIAAGGKAPRFELSNTGNVIADGLLHDVSKVALGVTDMQGEGQFGRDILLLVRSTFHLFMFAMAGQSGAVAALDSDELAAALFLALRPPESPAPAESAPVAEDSKASPAAPQKEWYVTRNGQSEGPYDESSLRSILATMPPETLVWSEGMPEWVVAKELGLIAVQGPAGCPHCGAVAVPGNRFCGTCGGSIL